MTTTDRRRGLPVDFGIAMLTIDGAIHLIVSGDLDLATSDEFQAAGEHALRGSQPTVLRIQLSGVGFIGAAGINALLEIRERARQARHELILDAPSRAVVRVLQLTGLTEHFHTS
jgi:anti-sigma B factor antagonist